VLLAKTLQSSTFKRALVWIAVFGAIVIALFGYVYWSTSTYVLSRADRMIAGEQAVLHKAYDSGGRSALIAAIEQGVADERLVGMLYLLTDSSFVPVAGNIKVWPSELKGAAAGWSNFGDRASNPDAPDRSSLRGTFETLPDGYHLLVGRDIGDLDEFAGKVNIALTLVISLIFVLAGAAGISVTRRSMRRIESINATSRAIMHSGLGKRIPMHGTRDEWDHLAENLNSMLDRIEALMREVKQVTDNVAHDLRTPLTRMRGRLEEACNGPRDRDRDQRLIDDTMADLDDVLRMFASITRISQIEARDRRAAFGTVDLAALAGDVVELFDAAAEENGTRLILTGDRDVVVMGDRDLLFDAVANLVDNALKHGRQPGDVTVDVVDGQGGAVLSVADNGPGVPAEERIRVLGHFYRLERSRGTPGNGLGLSIVAAVARLHAAQIEMLDNRPGLKVELRFLGNGMSAIERESAAGRRELASSAGSRALFGERQVQTGWERRARDRDDHRVIAVEPAGDDHMRGCALAADHARGIDHPAFA
jgi:signal transduction histidine kinase